MNTLFFLMILNLITIPHANSASKINGKEIVERSNCTACHGLDLNKPVNNKYPKLAGQYADYTYFALRAYQIGNANQLFGRDNATMHAQIQNFSESELKDVAEYIESLPSDLWIKN